MMMSGQNLQAAVAPGGADIAAAIQLVRNVVLQSALDCGCRDKVHEALRELEDFERQRNIVKLLAAAREEMSHYDEFDYVIINEDFDTAVGEMCSIFAASRLRCEPQQRRHAELIASLLAPEN